MKLGPSLITALGSLILLSSSPAPGEPQLGGWRFFVSRAGWLIRYPPAWTTASCHSCQDTKASNVYVDFFPPQASANDGSVMISPLADKPVNVPVETWFTQVEASANLNLEMERQRFLLSGWPALRVRYLNKNYTGGGIEMDEVYVVSGSHTCSIEFSGEKPGPLEKLSYFPIYKKMVETFKIR